ncbi:MAG: winged helix-turn-helix transcriptional regulator [Hyphomicrobiales bacterium]|nr:winged helix-turn-helix transcriptional regulator [Rickettsiales bacterium]MCP5362177.1 winged helix-turn-helix transcriptional regulator [Hyphomicrobiales bacterium]
MKQQYLSLILLIERLHRRFLDVIKTELERQGIEDINNVQTLILYNIGTEQLTVGELTHRGYYLGSNVSYNVKKLVESDYLIQERSAHDKRSIKVKLSDKGLKLCDKIDELYQSHVDKLEGAPLDEERMKVTFENLRQLEKFWSDFVSSVSEF